MGVMREALFNWIRNDLPDACVLDAFAGSGVLGFEALSQGAKHVIAIDNHQEAVDKIKANVEKIPSCSLEVFCGSFPTNIPQQVKNVKFQIVFLDPPFASQGIAVSLDWLATADIIDKSTLVFIHYKTGPFEIPSGWCLIKSKKRGQNTFALIQKQD